MAVPTVATSSVIKYNKEKLKVLIYISKRAQSRKSTKDFANVLIHNLQSSVSVDQNNHAKDIKQYDVVHVIGAWDKKGANILQKANKKHIATVFSPMGDFQPWNLNNKKDVKLTKSMIYQKTMAEEASVVHLSGEKEQQAFKKLGWNDRIVVVKNPILTTQISEAEMTSRMIAIYQKAIDSFCYARIGETQQDALGVLVHAGIDEEECGKTAFRELASKDLQTLTEKDWRNLYIYANNEGIIDIIRQGRQRLNQFLQPQLPELPTFNVKDSTFRIYPKINEEPLRSDKLQFRNIIMKSKLDECCEGFSVEQQITTMLLNIRHELHSETMSMKHLCELYQKIKFDKYDEDKLQEIFKRMRIHKFAARLIFVMNDVIGLSEGFMPIEPLDDKTADKLRVAITKLT